MSSQPKQLRSRSSRLRRMISRPGMAVMMVLLLLSLTLALSYAMLRTQTQVELLQNNFDRRLSARLAAQAGMAKALQAMNEADWEGVTSSVTGALDSQTNYSASYATGDRSLTTDSADYAEYPFRVTVTSTGTAVDQDNSAITATYTVQAVVQLIRKRFYSAPAGWSGLQNYTVMQWNSSRSSVVQTPMQITGNVYYRAIPTLFANYPVGTTPRSSYLTDLNAMRSDGYGDHRPFTGTVTLPSTTTAANQALLSSNLATTLVTHSSTSNNAPVSHPGNVESYRLYPGGKSYPVPDLYAMYGSTVSGVSLGTNPKSNPLGVYRTTSAIRLATNTSLSGTLLASSSNVVNLGGAPVMLTGINLPALHGSTTTYQLPVAIVNYELNVESGANCTIQGLAMGWDQFEVRPRTAATRLNLTGRIIANDVDLYGISAWYLDSSWWTWLYDLFLENDDIYEYFPVYLRMVFGMNYEPLLTVEPNSSGVQYHWHTWSQPVYIADPADGGLRWNLVSWTEGN